MNEHHRMRLSCEECRGAGKVTLTDGVVLQCDPCEGRGWVYLHESERPSFGHSAIAWVVTIGVAALVGAAIYYW